MKAMLLNGIEDLSWDLSFLELTDIPKPKLADEEVLIHVSVWSVCHPDPDEMEGRTPPDS